MLLMEILLSELMQVFMRLNGKWVLKRSINKRYWRILITPLIRKCNKLWSTLKIGYSFMEKWGKKGIIKKT